MYHLTPTGDVNIPKIITLNKGKTGRRTGHSATRLWHLTGLLLTGILLFPLLPYPAAQAGGSGLDVRIAWQIPLRKSERYLVELSAEPGFGTIAWSGEVSGDSLVWQAPSEGTWHWRLIHTAGAGGAGQAATGQTGAESSTFVSGSLVVVDPSRSRARPARVTWDPVEHADRYKLYVTTGPGQGRTMMTEATSFTIPSSDQALMIEVVPYTGMTRTFRSYHFNPSLKFDAGVDEPPPVAVVPPEPQPSPDAAVAGAGADGAQPPADQEPDPAPSQETMPAAPSVSGDPTAASAPEPARRKVHALYLFATHTAERLRMQKLEVDLDSEGRFTGAGAMLFANPVRPLILTAGGTYHEHRGEVPQESVFSGVTPRVDQARFTVEMAIGYDLATLFDSEHHVLALTVMGATTQAPFLPLVYRAEPDVAPKVEKKQISLFGAGAAYGYLSDVLSVWLDGGAMAQTADEAHIGFQRLLLEYHVSERFALVGGGLLRIFQAARCAPGSGTCLAEGKVRTLTQERAVFLGAGLTFF